MLHNDTPKNERPGNQDNFFSLIPSELTSSILFLLPLRDIAIFLSLCKVTNQLGNDNYFWYQLFINDMQQIDMSYIPDTNYKMEYQIINLQIFRNLFQALSKTTFYQKNDNPFSLDIMFIDILGQLANNTSPAILANALKSSLIGLLIYELHRQNDFQKQYNPAHANAFFRDNGELTYLLKYKTFLCKQIKKTLCDLLKVEAITSQKTMCYLSSTQECLQNLKELPPSETGITLPERTINTLLDRIARLLESLLNKEFSANGTAIRIDISEYDGLRQNNNIFVDTADENETAQAAIPALFDDDMAPGYR